MNVWECQCDQNAKTPQRTINIVNYVLNLGNNIDVLTANIST